VDFLKASFSRTAVVRLTRACAADLLSLQKNLKVKHCSN